MGKRYSHNYGKIHHFLAGQINELQTVNVYQRVWSEFLWKSMDYLEYPYEKDRDLWIIVGH